MSKVIANTFRHTAASSDAITLDNSGNATINGNLSVTGTNNAKYDDTNLRRDLNTLALQTAVDTNRKAYNLQNSFIDQFEDDTGIASHTTSDRDADGEFVSAVTSANVTVKPPFRRITSASDADDPFTSSWTGGGATNDSYSTQWAKNNQKYSGAAIDYLWDLSADWKLKVFFVDTNGDADGQEWHNFAGFMTTDTSKASGASPTGVWASNTDVQPSTIDRVGNNAGWDSLIDSSSYGAAGVSNAVSLDSTAKHNSVTLASSDGNRTFDMSGLSVTAWHTYWNHSTTYYGFDVTYDKSAATIVTRFITNTAHTTYDSSKMVTCTNVPSAGRVILAVGGAGTQSSSKLWSTTKKDGSDSDYSWYTGSTTSATGSIISNAQTASSSRTKVSGTILYKDASGTATLGTDLKVSFSCDNGSNWTALDATSGNYTAGSDFSTGIKTAYLKEVTCTAGTQIKYKVEWANQASGSKVTQLHGIAMNY